MEKIIKIGNYDCLINIVHYNENNTTHLLEDAKKIKTSEKDMIHIYGCGYILTKALKKDKIIKICKEIKEITGNIYIDDEKIGFTNAEESSIYQQFENANKDTYNDILSKLEKILL